VNRILIFLLSAYFGLGVFFSAVVAPVLFRSLERPVAGGIVEQIFPFYFGAGLGAAGVSLLIALTSKMSRLLITLIAANLLVLLALQFYVLPRIHTLKGADSPAFVKLHLLSVIMSVISLFFTFSAIIYLIVRTKDAGS